MGNKDDTRDVLPEELRLEDNIPGELCYDIIVGQEGMNIIAVYIASQSGARLKREPF